MLLNLTNNFAFIKTIVIIRVHELVYPKHEDVSKKRLEADLLVATLLKTYYISDE